MTNDIKNHKTDIKNFFQIIMTFLIFLLTQYLFKISIGSKSAFIYCVEFLIMFIALIAFLQLMLKKKKLIVNKKYIFAISLFALWFLALTIYRYYTVHDITGNFIIFRVVFFPLLLAALLCQYEISPKNILYGLLLFILYLNIEQIYSLIFVTNSFRHVTALKNINIYLCFAISSIPLLYYISNKTKDDKYNIITKLIVYFNLILIGIFSAFSGSRLAILMCPTLILLVYFFNNKLSLKSIGKFVLYIAVLVISIITIYHFDLYDSTYNIDRSIEPIVNIINKYKTNGESNQQANNNSNQQTNTNQAKNKNKISKKIKENNQSLDPISDVEVNLAESNNMRKLIWDKSIAYIRENPIFGRANIDIEIKMHFVGVEEESTLVQSPHNFILELWLSFGLPGLVLCSLMLLIFIIKVFTLKINFWLKLNCLITIFSIFSFSFFQPLVTCYFAISILLIINMYIYLKGELE